MRSTTLLMFLCSECRLDDPQYLHHFNCSVPVCIVALTRLINTHVMNPSRWVEFVVLVDGLHDMLGVRWTGQLSWDRSTGSLVAAALLLCWYSIRLVRAVHAPRHATCKHMHAWLRNGAWRMLTLLTMHKIQVCNGVDLDMCRNMPHASMRPRTQARLLPSPLRPLPWSLV